MNEFDHMLKPAEEIMDDLIDGTIGDLESAADLESAGDRITDPVTISRETVLTALQLLKTYNALYMIDYKEYCQEWD